jgi:PAS domain S-box-containing protein
MDAATLNAGPRKPRGIGLIRKIMAGLRRSVIDLTVAEKSYAIVAGLVIVTSVLLVMSIQTVRLQTGYRHLQSSSAQAANNIGRVNGLIYAIVMESRGIYMSTERAKVKEYADELVKRTRELNGVMKRWEETVLDDDAEQFAAFKQRIAQFVDFRKELVRRAVEISPAAGREWGDNDDNRGLRSQLNADLEALERIYNGRAHDAAELGDQGRYASWYLLALGFGALIFAALNVYLMKYWVIGPLSEITQATDLVAAGNIRDEIPHFRRTDEIGRLAVAVQNFRDALGRNVELELISRGTAKQRDAAMEQRDRFSDKYQATKWQLSAAINTMPQGIIMLDGKANVLAINERYRNIYDLPATIKAGSSLEDILRHRAKSGLFTGNVTQYLVAILARISAREPTSHEIVLSDGRFINIQERAMDGGGWVVVHEDVTAQRQGARILQRTELFLATVVENIPEGIVVKDARSLRYVFLNKAAEAMMGMPRTQVTGKTARELFPAETADLIERRDRQLMERRQQLEPIVDIIESPVRGRRTVAVKRLQVGGPDDESHLFVSMIEDRTEQVSAA